MLKPNQVFDIQSNQIYTKYPCQITLDDQDYDESSFIETSDNILLPGILDFDFPDQQESCKILINYPVFLQKTSSVERSGHIYTIYYDKNDLIISQEYKSNDVDIGLIRKLLQGHIKFINDPKVLLNVLIDVLGNVDVVYLELLISNMFRVSGNESQLCRWVGDYSNSTIIGVSKQPFVDSWKSALAFQHIDKAIQNGLINGQNAKNNPIENIMDEDFNNIT